MTSPATCHWHPDRETGLRCGACGKPICTECMRPHPVGIRCKQCGAPAPLPTHAVSTSYLLRGIAAAVAAGVAGNLALLLLPQILPFAGFFYFFLMLGLGYGVSAFVGAAVNRRRGPVYQWMAVGGVLIAAFPIVFSALAALLGAFSINSLIALGGVGVAVSIAWTRMAR